MAPAEQHKGPPSTLYGSDSGLGDARERIIRTAYDLFSRHGVQGVGIDLIVERSGVAKATLYRHFRSKDELAVAVLARREERWTHGWLQGEVEGRAITPEARLLAIFDVFDDWFRSDEYESCFFVRSLLESSDLGSAVGMAGRHRARRRSRVREDACTGGRDRGRRRVRTSVADADAGLDRRCRGGGRRGSAGRPRGCLAAPRPEPARSWSHGMTVARTLPAVVPNLARPITRAS